MKAPEDRTIKTIAYQRVRITQEEERRLRDEVSDFVAELLARRAAQLARFGSARRQG